MKNISLFRCIINTQIGQINNKRRDMLFEDLNKEFPVSLTSPDNLTILLRDDANKIVLTITPKQIVYSIENGNVEEKHIMSMQENLNKTFELLVLDDNVDVSYNFIRQQDALSKNSMEETAKRFLGTASKDYFLGVGLRTFFSYDGIISEIRFEPLIVDYSKYYIEATINCKNKEYKSVSKEALNAYDILEEKNEQLTKIVNVK